VRSTGEALSPLWLVPTERPAVVTRRESGFDVFEDLTDVVSPLQPIRQLAAKNRPMPEDKLAKKSRPF
jgi:hypothetical protein